MLLIPFFVPASVMTISYCLVAWGKNFQCKEEERERIKNQVLDLNKVPQRGDLRTQMHWFNDVLSF